MIRVENNSQDCQLHSNNDSSNQRHLSRKEMARELRLLAAKQEREAREVRQSNQNSCRRSSSFSPGMFYTALIFLARFLFFIFKGKTIAIFSRKIQFQYTKGTPCQKQTGLPERVFVWCNIQTQLFPLLNDHIRNL